MSETAAPTRKVPRATASAPSRTGETVTVASKLPNKFILQLSERHSTQQPMLGAGMVEVVHFRFRGGPKNQFTLNGTAVEYGLQRTYGFFHGAALTPGVPKWLWEDWCEQNVGCQLLVNGLIFAQPTARDVVAQAKEHKAQLTGLEPIDPTKPFRVGKKGGTVIEITPDGDSPKPNERALEEAQVD